MSRYCLLSLMWNVCCKIYNTSNMRSSFLVFDVHAGVASGRTAEHFLGEGEALLGVHVARG